ncbi:MAG: RluA family pseudouridine synthase [Rhodospirillales bacterium]|nr:RluA family pseudouridine synthase [Rhodospirillales bacterium]
MSVEQRSVMGDEAGLRLDRWFKRHFPALGHGRLEKLLRTGQIKVEGKRAQAGQRLEAGQVIRVPPLGDLSQPPPKQTAKPITEGEAGDLQARVLFKNERLIALDKPAGLAVQGGSGTTRHLDGFLDALRFDAPERPRLVHRLDKETSGVLVLARSAKAAAELAELFKGRGVKKTYWALVAGLPNPLEGEIDAPLSKLPGPAGEKMGLDPESGKTAITAFRVLDRAGRKVAWLELEPLTGRTHQLRVHCALLGTPILGDGKYGGAKAFPGIEGLGKGLHLHARAIEIPQPGGKPLRLVAPLPNAMRDSFKALGFVAEKE